MDRAPSGNYRGLTLATGIRSSALRTPNKTALVQGDRKTSYAQLVERINRAGNAGIGDLGLKPGDNVAIVADNRPEYIEVVVGLSGIGCAVATLNPRQTPGELQFIFEDCAARAVFVAPNYADAVRASGAACVERVIEFGGDYETWLSKARADLPPYEPAEWDNFTICYTSGTTGKPKGVVLPHRSRTLIALAESVEYGCYGRDDSFLAFAPMFHGAGFSFAFTSVFLGGTCEIVAGFDPEHILARLHEGRHTGVFMVPTHFHGLFALERPVLERYAAHNLKAIVCNAAPLPEATKYKVLDYFGDGLLHETYGSTETGIVTNLRPHDMRRKQNCVGQLFPTYEAKLLDDDGNPVAPGEVGELYAASPMLFNGYWNRPEETAAGFRDGLFSAGDMARQDEEGYFYIVDRKKDMLITGGVNVYPREIEDVLRQLPAVTDACVVGKPDDYWGEAVVAFVVSDDGALSDDAVIEHCKTRLGGFKVPKEVRFIDQVPRNPTGKMLKRELRDRLAQDG